MPLSKSAVEKRSCCAAVRGSCCNTNASEVQNLCLVIGFEITFHHNSVGVGLRDLKSGFGKHCGRGDASDKTSEGSEAEGVFHGHLLLRCEIGLDRFSRSATSATESLLEGIEVGSVVDRSFEFPPVFHVNEFVIVVGKDGEVNLSLCFDTETIAFVVGKVKTAETHAIAASLRARIVDDVAVYDCFVATKEGTFLTVYIVFLRTLRSVVEVVVFAVEAHGNAKTAELARIVREGSIEQHSAIGMDGVGERVGNTSFVLGGNYHLLTILQRRNLRC